MIKLPKITRVAPNIEIISRILPKSRTSKKYPQKMVVVKAIDILIVFPTNPNPRVFMNRQVKWTEVNKNKTNV